MQTNTFMVTWTWTCVIPLGSNGSGMHLVSNTSEPSASLLGFCLSGFHHFTLAADRLMLHPCLVFLRTLFIVKPFSAQLFIIIKIRLEAFCHPHSPHFPKTSVHLYNYIHTMAWHCWWCCCSILTVSFKTIDFKIIRLQWWYKQSLYISPVNCIRTCCTAEPSYSGFGGCGVWLAHMEAKIHAV